MSVQIGYKLYDSISPEATKEFSKYPIISKVTTNPSILIARSNDLNKNAEVETALVVGRAGIGTNNIPVNKLTLKYVPVIYAPGGNADSVAESTVGKILDAAKNTIQSNNFVKNYEDTAAALEKVKKQFEGMEIKGRTIVIIGIGNIATRVAYILSKLGMKVIIQVRTAEKEYVKKKLAESGELAQKILKNIDNPEKVKITDKLDDQKNGQIVITSNPNSFAKADFISPHIGSQNKPIFNEEFFAKVKKGAIIVNMDRDDLVDEEALLTALENKQIGSYHTDFAPASLILRKHQKVFASPHTAASTAAAEDNCAKMVVNKILDYTFDGNIANSKNFPKFNQERMGANRITISASAEQDYSEQLKAYLKENNLGVVQSGSAKNKSIKYYSFDINEKLSDEQKTQIINDLQSLTQGKVRILDRNPEYEQVKAKNALQKMVAQPAVYNFSAGPSHLPREVILGLMSALDNYNKTGMSMAEMSHRGKDIEGMVNNASALVKKLLKVPDNYTIIFQQGGGTQQFAQIPMNFSKKGDKIGYVETGTWSKKAIEDAEKLAKIGYGTPVVIASNSNNKFKALPEIPEVPQDLKYLYIASNETIHGLEYDKYPDTGKVPLIVDASSDIFSQPIDWSKNIGMIYAGAQKNTGMAGSTLCIIRNDLIDKNVNLPAYLKYSNHVAEKSLYNTPPVVAIHSVELMMKWLEKQGGVAGIQKKDMQKAAKLYKAIDESKGFYIGRVSNPEHRSKMNVVFNMKTKELEEKFVKEAVKEKLLQLGGHKSIGGLRASIFNAMPEAGVDKLIAFMKKFQKETEETAQNEPKKEGTVEVKKEAKQDNQKEFVFQVSLDPMKRNVVKIDTLIEIS